MLRWLCISLALVACQPVGSGDGGLMLVSDTAQVGPPPACNAAPTTGDEAPTTGDDATTGADGTTDAALDAGVMDLSLRTASAGAAKLSSEPGSAVEVKLSSRPAATAAPDPGTSYCAQFTSAATCDGTLRKDGEQVIGECRWWQVVPVVPGGCEATTLYDTCVHVPVKPGPCEAPGSCGQIGLGVYGRTGCDGTIEIIVVPPGQAFCAAPTDWPLCWPRDDADLAPECTCICS